LIQGGPKKVCKRSKDHQFSEGKNKEKEGHQHSEQPRRVEGADHTSKAKRKESRRFAARKRRRGNPRDDQNERTPGKGLKFRVLEKEPRRSKSHRSEGKGVVKIRDTREALQGVRTTGRPRRPESKSVWWVGFEKKDGHKKGANPQGDEENREEGRDEARLTYNSGSGRKRGVRLVIFSRRGMDGGRISEVVRR